MATVAANYMYEPFEIDDNRQYKYCREHYNCADFDKAFNCFKNLLDSDQQFMRATPASNEIVRELAREFDIPLLDFEARIIRYAENGIPGFDLFDGYCHLNDRGNVILQQAFFNTIQGNDLIN